MKRITPAVFLLSALLAACSQLPQAPGGASALSSSEAQGRYQQGLAAYRENRFDAALGDLNAAISSGKLNPTDTVNARKHAAFIYCTSAREPQCREQFQAILAADPAFDLPANEAGHPQWGPIWRSLKGAVEEKRAVDRASSATATPAQQKLAEGIKDYEAGRYKESLDALQASLKAGLPAKTDELRAHKYVAFTYCLTQRARQCRIEFRQIFKLDPAFELLPSEAGHPAWASIYRSEKQAAAKQGKKK
jgi:tetratricopeptide (TPR) repeat protein